ncbi:DUF4833 domain-containing protein [Flavobacterium sp. RHBU_3]|uniref:DUF4833 domain-containing protein n=1 Tax=Flavobacterium sp. RHBU_3 TaxID=3391184 RepID=UPI003984ADF1
MSKLVVFVFFFLPFLQYAQQGYPTPADSQRRLFYIQHSKNHNTFVYDANLAKAGKLNTADPVEVYRITYEEGGAKEELTQVQRKMAYGVTVNSVSASGCEFTLSAYPAQKLVLKLGKEGKPYVTTHINGKTITLKRLYLQMGKLGTNVLYIDFYGKDANGKEVSERLYVK